MSEVTRGWACPLGASVQWVIQLASFAQPYPNPLDKHMPWYCGHVIFQALKSIEYLEEDLQKPVEEAAPESPGMDHLQWEETSSQREELADFMEQVWAFALLCSTFVSLYINI